MRTAAWYEALLAAGDAVTAMDVVAATSGKEWEPSTSAVREAMVTLQRQIGERRGRGERVYAVVDAVVAVDPDSWEEEVVYSRLSGAGGRVDSVVDWTDELGRVVEDLRGVSERLHAIRALIEGQESRTRDGAAVHQPRRNPFEGIEVGEGSS